MIILKIHTIITMIKKNLLDLWLFTKNPGYVFTAPVKIKQILHAMAVILIANFIMQMLLAHQVTLLSEWLFGAQTHLLIEYAAETPALLLFLTVAIAAPFIEELAFRLPLLFKPIYVSMSIVSLTPFVSEFFFHQVRHPWLPWAVSMAIAVILFFVLSMPSIYRTLSAWWQQNIRWIVYGFVLTFGLMHISNFGQITPMALLFSPLLCLPQIISGFVLSYFRLRFGFQWALFYHFLWNGIAISIVILAKSMEALPIP